MRTNKTYTSLLNKSINSMLSAIEIYNKPNFSYREETFAILAVNAWELLLKAFLLKKCGYNMNSLYVMEKLKTQKGTIGKREKPKLNRAGNPQTIGIFEVIKKIENKGTKISDNLKNSIEALVELRDNAIHFYNENEFSKLLLELGFACIKNYMQIIKELELEIDLSHYNFYLMPLAYIDSKIDAAAIKTDETNNYIHFIKNKINGTMNNDEYMVAISIDVKFNKSNSFDSISVKNTKDGTPITLVEEDMKKRYPLDYKAVIKQARTRYSNFKQNDNFHARMKEVKQDSSVYNVRYLDPGNEKSSTKGRYNTAVFDKHLDNQYIKVKK